MNTGDAPDPDSESTAAVSAPSTRGPAMPRPRRRWAIYIPWLRPWHLHALGVSVVYAYFSAAELLHQPEDGANIGAGLALLLLFPLGLPWTAPALIAARTPLTHAAFLAGPAINVGIHYFLARRRAAVADRAGKPPSRRDRGRKHGRGVD